MRTYLLTEQEEKIIRHYLETGQKLESFKVLLHRVRHMEKVKTDLTLIDRFLAKVKTS